MIITKRNITHDGKTGIRNWCESYRDWIFKVCKYLSENQLKECITTMSSFLSLERLKGVEAGKVTFLVLQYYDHLHY